MVIFPTVRFLEVTALCFSVAHIQTKETKINLHPVHNNMRYDLLSLENIFVRVIHSEKKRKKK